MEASQAVIRLMQADDIDRAMSLKEAANWNQTRMDWERILRLEPTGCFVDAREGTLAGTTTVLRYENDQAWIGMVLVLPRFRRRGIATALMQHALAWVSARGIPVSRLDATLMGRPLYLRLGFKDEEVIERWERPAEGDSPAAYPDRPSEFPSHLMEADRHAFGCNRSRLLRDLADDPSVDLALGDSGFAFSRPGSAARQIGPCVASRESAAESLLCETLALRPGERVFWDLLPSNKAACRLARRLGFRRARRLVRMARIEGKRDPVRPCPARVYAAAGFEFG